MRLRGWPGSSRPTASGPGLRPTGRSSLRAGPLGHRGQRSSRSLWGVVRRRQHELAPGRDLRHRPVGPVRRGRSPRASCSGSGASITWPSSAGGPASCPTTRRTEMPGAGRWTSTSWPVPADSSASSLPANERPSTRDDDAMLKLRTKAQRTEASAVARGRPTSAADPLRRFLGWCVHAYTALGLIARGDDRRAPRPRRPRRVPDGRSC